MATKKTTTKAAPKTSTATKKAGVSACAGEREREKRRR